MTEEQQLPPTLLDLLHNSVILRQTAPYLGVPAVLALSRTCRALHKVISTDSDAWRHADLSYKLSAAIDSSPIDVGGMSWRAERMDEALTEDEFYGGPLQFMLGRLQTQHLLKFVQTLILDGLSVTADLVREIMLEDAYHVRILSIRGAKHLNMTKLQQVLRYAVRPTRAEGTPKLRALYVFGSKDSIKVAASAVSDDRRSTGGVMASEGAQIGAAWNHRSSASLNVKLADEETRWYETTGRALPRQASDWPDTLQACKGIIAFDAVLCRGPRHDITKVDSRDFLQPALAVVALGPRGCESCGSCPESPAIFGQHPDYAFPLLGPVPVHASTVRAAQRPMRTVGDRPVPLIIRCEDCLKGRWCEGCNRWWCEDCYRQPLAGVGGRQSAGTASQDPASVQQDGAVVKVYSRLCVEHCLVSEMMSGAGSNGMWG